MKTVRWVLIAVGAFLSLGCEQKLTYDRWELVRDGQSPEAVEATLGKPCEKMDLSWLYMDMDRGITANIYFQDNKVTGKTWADPNRGMQGKSPNVNQAGDKEELKYQKIK